MCVLDMPTTSYLEWLMCMVRSVLRASAGFMVGLVEQAWAVVVESSKGLGSAAEKAARSLFQRHLRAALNRKTAMLCPQRQDPKMGLVNRPLWVLRMGITYDQPSSSIAAARKSDCRCQNRALACSTIDMVGIPSQPRRKTPLSLSSRFVVH